MHTQCHKGRCSFRSLRGFRCGLHAGIKHTCCIVMGHLLLASLLVKKKLLSWAHVGGGCSWLRGRVVVCEKHICPSCILWLLTMSLHCEASCWDDENCNSAIFYPRKFELTSFYCNVLLSKWGQEHLSISQLLHRMCCDVTGSNAGDNTSASNYKARSSQQTKWL